MVSVNTLRTEPLHTADNIYIMSSLYQVFNVMKTFNVENLGLDIVKTIVFSMPFSMVFWLGSQNMSKKQFSAWGNPANIPAG